METRRDFIKAAAVGGIAAIVASKQAPAFAQDMKKVKIGQLGLGSHGFAGLFKNPGEKYKDIIKCRPYAIWDDVPGVAEKMKERMGFEIAVKDPVELVKQSDVVHIEHADFRKVLGLARPALEAGKPIFINRPFVGTVADADELIRLAQKYNAPVMGGSSLEYQPSLPEIGKFIQENGPLRHYECYCPEPFFDWMFPHVIYFANAALGCGVESAYFTGDFVMEFGEFKQVKDVFVDPKRPYGSAVSLVKYKPFNGQPPVVGMNVIGGAPGSYHLTAYCNNATKEFVMGDGLNAPNIFEPMFLKLNEFYINHIPPRPYESMLEQHRVHVATNVSRMTGRAVRLDSLKPTDSLPWSDQIRNYVLRSYRS
ncbi:MAG: Gfo/Idh/MocA family oxidoreductase [Candidatus Latescibacterota bacterium]